MAFQLAEGYVDVPVRHGALDRGLSTAEKKIRTFSTNARNIFMASGAMAATLGAGLGYAAKGAMDLNEALAQIEKVTDKETMEGLRQPIREMAEEIPLTHVQLTQLAEDAGRLGVEGSARIEQFVRTAAKMGTATTVETEKAGTNFARLANALRVPIEEAENMGSSINELSNNVAATSREIVGSMMRAAPAAGQLEMKFSDVAAMSSTLVAAGMQVSRSGTRMNRMFAELAEKTDVAAKHLGITTDEFRQMLDDNPTKAIMRLAQSLTSIESKSMRLKKANELVGATGGKVLSTLSSNYRELSSNLDLASSSYSEATSLNREFNIQSKTTSTQLTLLRNKFENVRQSIGRELLPKINSLAGGLGGIMDGINGYLESHPRFTAAVGNIGTTMLVAAGGVAALTGAVWGLTTAVGVLGGPVTIAIGAIAGLSAAGAGMYSMFSDNERVMQLQVRQADALSKRYEELVRQTDRTTAEEVELERATQKLKELFPEYADEIDGTKKSLEELDEAQRGFWGGGAGRSIREEELRKREEQLKHDIPAVKANMEKTRKLMERYYDKYKEMGGEGGKGEVYLERANRIRKMLIDRKKHVQALQKELQGVKKEREKIAQAEAEAAAPELPEGLKDYKSPAEKDKEKTKERSAEEVALSKRQARIERGLMEELALTEAKLSEKKHAVEMAHIDQWFSRKKSAIENAYEDEKKREEKLSKLRELKRKKEKAARKEGEREIQQMREAGIKRLSAFTMKHGIREKRTPNTATRDTAVAQKDTEAQVVSAVDSLRRWFSDWERHLAQMAENTKVMASSAESGRTPGGAKGGLN